MPFLLILVVVILGAVVFLAVLMPLSLVMRFRSSAARRRAWGWMIAINLFAAAMSSTALVLTAAISNSWIPHAFRYTLAGLVTGALLGLIGLATSRWERTPQGLYYKPNRWLILMLSLIVTARIIYGFWRAWNAWQTTPDYKSWIGASGAAGSMGAGAAVLGYYLIYWIGVRRKLGKIEELSRVNLGEPEPVSHSKETWK